jgi:predicted AAA+ superfamily ATPase
MKYYNLFDRVATEEGRALKIPDNYISLCISLIRKMHQTGVLKIQNIDLDAIDKKIMDYVCSSGGEVPICYREIARTIGVPHPQTIKNKIVKLERFKLIGIDKIKKTISVNYYKL